jgi:hypothetical protein
MAAAKKSKKAAKHLRKSKKLEAQKPLTKWTTPPADPTEPVIFE